MTCRQDTLSIDGFAVLRYTHPIISSSLSGVFIDFVTLRTL
jgi:hypothetical protein